jgi:hypothetical protein
MHDDHPPEAMCLTKLGRIAIWKRDKVISAIVMGILMTDIGFMINGKYSASYISWKNLL